MSEHDPMEDLFRDRAESYEYPFNEKDWSALEARLDREMPARGGNFWGYVLSTLLLVSIPWWPWNIENHQSAPSNKTEQIAPNQNGTPSVSEAVPTMTEGEIANSTSSENDLQENATSSSIQTPRNTNSEVSPQTNNTTTSNLAANSNTNVTNGTNAAPMREVVQSEEKRKAIDLLALNSKSLNRNEMTLESQLIPNEETPWTIEELILSPVNLTSEDDGGDIVSTDDKLRDWQVWSPYVLVGTEYGGTQMNNSPSLGFRAGAGIRYRPFEQWSASIGVNYANIGYTAYGDEYNLQYDLPVYHNLDWTDGHCYMFEFPVEVRWHPLEWLNIGTGLRSYYIQKETYDLYVKYDYGPIEKHGVTYEDPHSSLMAHWILSAGFAIPVGSDYIEINPFYQIPLKGLGHGSVWWHSAGVSMMYLF
ncbi:MAG: hypothetical protein HWE14_07160 [Flavobacteriia bacterium]|nr:hypothetical protein [Flavobacteriia bacterium]